MADKPNWVFDSVGAFTDGMNSGILPSQLQRTQLAYATNATVRGGYASPRAPVRRITLDYGGDGVLQSRVEDGRFQGSAFYRSDAGTGSLVAAIGGRLFQFTPGATTAAVREITIAHNTIVQVGFAVPALGANVTITVLSTVNLGANYEIKIGTHNYVIVSVDSATVLTVENVDDPGPLVAAGAVLTFWDVNPASRTQAWLWQAEKWLIVNDGQSVPIFFDGATSRRSVLVGANPELGIARMGTYWMGRVWQAGPDGRTFLAGDAVGGASGTAALQFRDAVLHVTENLYLASNKVFYVPGAVGDITAIRGVPTLDSSLGQGPVQILTPQVVFSCNAPTLTADWATVTNPILTVSQVESGGLSQYSTVLANGDVMYRSRDGVRSLILGRREFATWGNVPLSREVSAVLDKDDPALLAYSTAVVFDNRLLMSVSPVFTQHGVLHRGWVALNFDLISSLRGKAPSSWDGVETGIEVLQFVKGTFDGVERCFAFVLYRSEEVQLWEILPSATDIIDDTNAPILWSLETPAMFRDDDPRRLIIKRIEDGELWVQDVIGRVDVTVKYRRDLYPCWEKWTTFAICAERPSCVQDPLTGCIDISNSPPQTRIMLGFGKPSGACDPISDMPLTDGNWFQFRLELMGHCRILSVNFMASIVPSPKFTKPVCSLLEDSV
jgi:hypothetical protein